MRNKKPLVAAVLVVAPVLGWANPAAAEVVQGDDSEAVQFSYTTQQGEEVTCWLTGNSNFIYENEPDQPDHTTIGAENIWTFVDRDDAEGCESSMASLSIFMTWKNEDGEVEGSTAQTSNDGAFLNGSGFTRGPVTDISVTHQVVVECLQENEPTICTFDVVTTPK